MREGGLQIPRTMHRVPRRPNLQEQDWEMRVQEERVQDRARRVYPMPEQGDLQPRAMHLRFQLLPRSEEQQVQEVHRQIGQRKLRGSAE